LTRALRVRDQFLASMSHELRTPLNAIIGFTGILRMKLPGRSRRPGGPAAHGRHQRQAPASLISDLLDLARIESGEVELSVEPTVCQHVVREVLNNLRPLAEAKGLGLEANMPSKPGWSGPSGGCSCRSCEAHNTPSVHRPRHVLIEVAPAARPADATTSA